MDWGDFDNDGDLDLLYSYIHQNTQAVEVTKLFINTNGNLTASADTIATAYGRVRSGDFDNDGDLDFAQIGSNPGIYRNDGSGSFTKTSDVIVNYVEALDWGDFDNDGDLDLVVAGTSTGFYYQEAFIRLYRNNNGSFASAQSVLSVPDSLYNIYTVQWVDYDNDNDLDLTFSNDFGGPGTFPTTRGVFLINNNGGLLSSSGNMVQGINATWGDYDQDGDLDIGCTRPLFNGYVYFTNSAGVFANDIQNHWTVPILTGLSAFGDFNNDGALDHAQAGGFDGTSQPGGIFTTFGSPLTSAVALGTYSSPMDGGFADYDNDGDLDFLISGNTTFASGANYVTKIVTSTAATPNTPPTVPTGLALSFLNSDCNTTSTAATFTWNASTDNETASAGLTYNLRIGTTLGGSEVMSIANSLKPVMGNVQQNLSWTIEGLNPNINYYWSVAAVDNSYQGSGYAPEQIYTPPVGASLFVDAGVTLPGIGVGSVAWGDYDKDGDMDILSVGNQQATGGSGSADIYRNDGGSFVAINAGFVPVTDGKAVFVDYDNDNDLDVCLMGKDNAGTPVLILYRNTNNVFTNIIDTGFPGLYDGSMSWADFDGDSRPDLAVMGKNNTNFPITRVYKNLGNQFLEIQAGLPGMYDGDIAWQNKAGDLPDLIISGKDETNSDLTRYYRNDFGRLISISLPLSSQVSNSAIATNNIAFPDLYEYMILGTSVDGTSMQHFMYDSLTEMQTGLSNGDALWIDYDNDGDNDMVISGVDPTLGNLQTLLYENINDDYTLICSVFPIEGAAKSRITTADYDNDGDLDLLFTSFDALGQAFGKIYRNEITTANMPPSVPLLPRASLSCNYLTFQWDVANDAQTRSPVLTYNLRVGTSPGASDVLSATSLPSGYHTLSNIGNTGMSSQFSVPIELGLGTVYYWSVQTIDNGYAASAFTPEQVVMPDTLSTPAIFSEVVTTIAGRIEPDMQWVDYDLDGDHDLYISGYNLPLSDPNSISDANIYRNDGNGSFSLISTPFPKLTDGLYLQPGNKSAAWADFDNDGDPDLALTTLNPAIPGGDPRLRIYSNTNGIFTEVVNRTHVENEHKKMLINDFDADGDEDIFLFSNTDSYVFRNERSFNFERFHFYKLNRFNNSDIAFTGIGRSMYMSTYQPDSIAQFSVDTYLLELLGVLISFDDINYSTNLSGSSIDPVDYDADGYEDILITGVEAPGQNPRTILFRNNGDRTYTDIQAGFIPLGEGTVQNEWGDFDGDGDLDILAYGLTTSPVNRQLSPTLIYRNDGNDQFAQISECFEEVTDGGASWTDFDNDGDLDFLISGADPVTGALEVHLYQNSQTIINSPPSAPQVTATYRPFANALYFNISGSDVETPKDGLSHNLRVGTSPGGGEIRSPGAFSSNQPGNSNVIPQWNNTSETWFNWIRKDIIPGQTYYFSAQTIDQSGRTSAFSEEKQITIPNPFNRTDLNLNINRTVETHWGDYDADGDMDLLAFELFTGLPRIFRNDNGQLIDLQINLPASRGSVDNTWWDFDSDGDLDIILSVMNIPSNQNYGTQVYENKGNDLFELKTSLIGSLLPNEPYTKYWLPFDYNSDGNIDVLSSATHVGYYLGESADTLWVFENNGTSLVEVKKIPAYILHGIVDVDNNGYKDLVLSNMDADSSYLMLHKNTGAYTATITLSANKRFILTSDVSFGDYDNDGDTDFLANGLFNTNGNSTTDLLSNEGNDRFIRGTYFSYRASRNYLGDMDNDGSLNFLHDDRVFLGGQPADKRIEINTLNTELPTSDMRDLGNFSVVDFDNDGDLDVFTSGVNRISIFQDSVLSTPGSILYINDSAQANNAPQPPANLRAFYNTLNQSLQFSWVGSTDDHTPTPGLTYSIRIGTAPGLFDIVAPESIVAPGTSLDGKRQVVKIGNIGQVTTWKLNNVIPGQDYYWSVQAIDHSYVGSAFAIEQVAAANISNGSGTLSGVMGSGPGSSGGRVISGRKMEVDSPIADVRIALVNILTSDTLLLDKTDSKGNFDFLGVPNGAYKVHVDYNNLPMDANNPTLNFVQDDETIEVTVLVNGGKLSVTLNSRITGTEEDTLQKQIQIFPNPTSGFVNIKVQQPVIISLISLTGRLLDTFSIGDDGEATLNTSSYPPGLYILRIATEKAFLNYKLVKQ
ncbi:MAG: T9SS type A sorting domain-containing protein [Cyclobacteriaceae bacterium]